MRNLKKYLVVAFFSAAFFFVGTSSAFAALYPTNGWGWMGDDNHSQGFCVHTGDSNPTGLPLCIAGGLGWISFSNVTDGTAIPYGVYVNGDTGEISGYAWSANGGWITFNTTDMIQCNYNTGDHCPNGVTNPHAQIALVISPSGTMTGTGKVTGWARMCSVFVSGCRGAVRPASETGGWDGWISLSGTTGGGGTYGWEFDTAKQEFKSPSGTGTAHCDGCYSWSGGSDGTGFGWGMLYPGMKIELTPPPSFGLTFWADANSLLSGGSTNLNWLVTNIWKCDKGGDWNGSFSGTNVTNGKHTESTGAISSNKTYTLQCWSSEDHSLSTARQTVNVDIVAVVNPQNGKCGIAANSPSRSKPVNNLCDIGTPSAVTQSGGNWVWQCNGVNGGSPASCSAEFKSGFQFIPF